MFLVLTFAVVLHQACVTLSDEVIDFPLRLLMIRLIESFGRVSIFPLASALFAVDFGASDKYYLTFLYALVIPVTILIFLMQLTGLRQSYRGSLTGLVYKVNSSETNLDKLTYLEVFVFNLFVFKKLSLSNVEIKTKRQELGAFANPLSGAEKISPEQDFLRDLKHFGSEDVKETLQHKENNSNSPTFDINDIYQSGNLKTEEVSPVKPVDN